MNMNKKSSYRNFDPNDLSRIPGNLYGLPHGLEDASVVILPVPWEVTVSYKQGTAEGPSMVLQASHQVDLYDLEFPDAWKKGLYMDEISQIWKAKSKKLRKKAAEYIAFLEKGSDSRSNRKMHEIKVQINKECNALNKWVFKRSSELLSKGKIVGTLGGDHSTCLGLIQAMAARYKSFSILQIDAHADLRQAYEGFTFSHASIMYNALKLPQLKKLVQVGVRDLCEAEARYMAKNSRVICHYDREIKKRQYSGESWDSVCDEIVKGLSEQVYISFDVDGLKPDLCPHTGTPVPGGLDFEEAVFLMKKVKTKGKKIIGFDISETGNSEWDGNVTARILWRLAHLLI